MRFRDRMGITLTTLDVKVIFIRSLIFLFLMTGLLHAQDFTLLSQPKEIEVGSPFTIEVQCTIPEESKAAFHAFLETLLVGRPVPWPFFLTKYEMKEGHLFLTGCMLQEGPFTLAFPSFSFMDKSFSFQPCTIVATPLRFFPPSKLLLPYPELALSLSDKNMLLERKHALLKNDELQTKLSIQHKIRHIAFGLIFFLLLLPIFHYLVAYLKKKYPPIKKEEQPLHVLERIKKSSQEEEKRKELLKLLITLSGKEPSGQTSKELVEVFTRENKPLLSEAASIVEQSGYQEAHQIGKALDLVESFLGVVRK